MRIKTSLTAAVIAASAAMWLMALGAHAQQAAKVLSACGTASYVAGTTNYETIDTTGASCGAAGTVSGTVTANQGAAGSAATPWPVEISNTSGNIAVVTAASTAAAPTDKSLVVAPTPNTVTANPVASTPTVQNASYVSGNCLGGFNAVTVAPNNGQTGFVTNVRLTSIGGATTGITVYLFSANPSASTCTDRSTFTLNSADVDKLIAAPFALTPAAPIGTSVTIAAQTNMGLPFIAGGTTSSGVKTIYYALVAGGTFTPATTSDIHVGIGAAF